jgi:PAS domain S-box-containing protein
VQALRDSEAYFHSLIEHLSDYLLLVNSDGAIKFSSPSFNELIGYTPEEVTGESAFKFIWPGDVEYIKVELKAFLSNPEIIREVNIHVVNKNGKSVFLRGKAQNLLNHSLFNGILLNLQDITEYKLSEEALRASEEQYRRLVEGSPNSIAIHVNGKFIYVNSAGAKLIGAQSPQELIGMPVLNIIHPDYRSSVIDRLKSSDEGKESPLFEEKFMKLDGSVIDVEVVGIPFSYQGQPAVQVIARDITERKRTEVKLQESEERYRVFINSTGDMVFLKDENLKYVIVNKENAAFFNKVESEILGKTDFELMPEEAAQRCQLTDKIALCSDTVIIHKEEIGDKVYESRKFKILLKNGSYGVGGYIRNITKEIEAQIALQKSEHLFNTLATISPVGIFHAGTDGRTTYVNPALCQMAGISEEMAIGNGWLSAIHPDDKEMVVGEMKASIQNQSGSAFEYRFLRPDGSIVSFIGKASPEVDSNKHLVGFVGTLTDITELKNMEGNLIVAKEKAEESDRLKTAFLHNISHEIRTPMNAIMGFSTLLGEPDVTHKDQISFINIIQQSSNQLLSIITDIFNISNIEANIVNINLSEANLNLTLKKIYDQFFPMACAKNISLHFETTLESEKSVIHTDITKLIEILSNLISNAFKFTKQGEITFGYTLKDQFIEFYVSDTGIGIQTDQYTKIFDRFYQVENAISRQYEGTGLGLSICKSYVELLGGKIWLTSEMDKGSVFYFTIPYIQGKQPEDHLIVEKTKNIGTYNKSIIIAEDDEINYLLILKMLSGLGLNILHAWDGSEAVDMCKQNPGIDLVLMDMKMPVMDGYEAARHLKKSRPDLPIIAQTAYALGGDMEKAIAAGCDDYIAKPLNKTSLIKSLNKFLAD